MKRYQTDFLVVGAGVIGSAVAMGLGRLGCDRVMVVDLDMAGEWSSSELNAGGVRATWSQQVNLLASKFSIEYFAKNAETIGYRACGYLWMHRPDTFKQALKTREMHVANGWPVDVLDVPALRKRLPFIDKTDDLAGALFGVRDGLVNPNRLKEHYREEGLSKGVGFLDRIWITNATRTGFGIVVSGFEFVEQVSSEKKKELLSKNPQNLDAEVAVPIEIKAGTVINCAGAWAPHLAKILGYKSPSKPVRRQISLFHARDLDLTSFGMMIDPSGVYFHPESVYGLAGYANPGETPGYHFGYDSEDFFQKYIWAPLAERSTAFESLRHISGWSGLYENSPDHHACIGEAIPGSRIFEAHSFSGHGVMQSYAVGVALPELIVKGRYESLDLSELSGLRFKQGRSIAGETWVI